MTDLAAVNAQLDDDYGPRKRIVGRNSTVEVVVVVVGGCGNRNFRAILERYNR